jgi:hypothetical protein
MNQEDMTSKYGISLVRCSRLKSLIDRMTFPSTCKKTAFPPRSVMTPATWTRLDTVDDLDFSFGTRSPRDPVTMLPSAKPIPIATSAIKIKKGISPMP